MIRRDFIQSVLGLFGFAVVAKTAETPTYIYGFKTPNKHFVKLRTGYGLEIQLKDNYSRIYECNKPLDKFNLNLCWYDKTGSLLSVYFCCPTIEKLLDKIDDIVELCEYKRTSKGSNEYVTFSSTGIAKPIRNDEEYVLTVFDDKYNILCPKSAGGDWEEFDLYHQGRLFQVEYGGVKELVICGKNTSVISLYESWCGKDTVKELMEENIFEIRMLRSSEVVAIRDTDEIGEKIGKTAYQWCKEDNFKNGMIGSTEC